MAYPSFGNSNRVLSEYGINKNSYDFTQYILLFLSGGKLAL